MKSDSTLSPVIVPLNESRVVHAYGDEAIFHLEEKHTGGKFTMWTNITPPGGGPPPHYHNTEDEWWFVLEGRASFLVDGHWREVGPGSGIFAPRGSVHTFKNVGTTPLKQLITTSPSGFEVFFSRSAEEFSKPGGPSMERLTAIAAEHDIHFVQP